MEELLVFYERHKGFVLSSVYLTACLLLAGYSIMYSSRQAWIIHSQVALQEIRKENSEAAKKLRDFKEARTEKNSGVVGIRSLPEFLKRINNIARETKVIIVKLTPDPNKTLRFNLQIIEDYYDFIKFSAKLESLNVNIHDIEVHPYDLGKQPPLHVISFSLTPRADAEPLSSVRISNLANRVKQKNRRNPFQRFAYNAKEKLIRPEIDLTWDYKLSGIGRVGDKRYVTINSQDYDTGDKFNGMVIKKIESKRVYLEKETPNGIEKYQLKFRRSKKKKKA